MGLKHTLGRLTETLFFDTDKRLYWREQTFGIASEAFRIPGLHESTLSGKVFHAESVTSEYSRGLIVYAGAPVKNLSFNLPQILWLAAAGIPVVGFDWPGAGESTGVLTLNGMERNLEAVLQETQRRFPETAIILFGQGPGADAALRVAQHEHAIRGLILESVYATHAGWLIDRYGPGVGHIAASFLPGQSSDPLTLLPSITMPIALFCPAYDDFVPTRQTALVLKALPKNALCIKANCGGYASLFSLPGSHREAFLSFCNNVFLA